MIALVWLAAGLVAHAAPPPRDVFLYKVKPHETLIGIGQRGLQPASAYREVWRLNHVLDDRELPIGSILRIPWPLLRTMPILATVEGFAGAASAAEGGAKQPVTAGRTLREGATVSTGENAFVRLALPDGSHLMVPSNSRIRLDRLRMVALTGSVDRQISVQAGGLDSQVTPMTNPASRFVVVTPVAQSSVRGTEFRVAYDAGRSRATAGVLKGAVGVANAKADILAPAGQGAVATPGGVKGPIPLLPAPMASAASAVQAGDGLHIEFAAVSGAGQYRVVIATDAKLETPVFSAVTARTTVDAPGLPEGAYYLKLTAISRDGLEGLPGVSSFLSTQGQLLIQGATPTGKGVTEFRWTAPGNTPATYRFTLARRSDREHPIVIQDGMNEGRFTAPTPPGDYVWMVFARRTVAGRKVELVSDPQSLHVP